MVRGSHPASNLDGNAEKGPWPGSSLVYETDVAAGGSGLQRESRNFGFCTEVEPSVAAKVHRQLRALHMRELCTSLQQNLPLGPINKPGHRYFFPPPTNSSRSPTFNPRHKIVCYPPHNMGPSAIMEVATIISTWEETVSMSPWIDNTMSAVDTTRDLRLPRQHIASEEWEIHRETIRELYVERGLTLEAVMKFMATQYGFCPT